MYLAPTNVATSPNSVPADRCFVQVDVYLLGLEIFFDARRPELAAKAGLLEASPRRFHVGRLHVIDPDDPGAQTLLPCAWP